MKAAKYKSLNMVSIYLYDILEVVKLEQQKEDKYLWGMEMRQKDGLQRDSGQIFRVMGIFYIMIIIVFTLLYICQSSLNSSLKRSIVHVNYTSLDIWNKYGKMFFICVLSVSFFQLFPMPENVLCYNKWEF